jgi:hypothetical protein
MAEATKSRIITEGTSGQTTLKVLQVTNELILLEYELLPDTNPGANGNLAAIWQNTDNIPYNLEPFKKQAISGASQKGVFSFDVDLTRNNYILGYSVGPELSGPSQQKVGNVCSTVFFPLSRTLHSLKEGDVVEADPHPKFSTTLTIGIISTDVVTFSWEVPTDCTPASNGAWAGLFEGKARYNVSPKKAVPIKADRDSGVTAIEHKLAFDREYSIAYFMSGWSDDKPPIQTRMAATISFVG